MVSKSEIVKRFGKKALLEAADEMEIDGVDDSTHVYKVIDAIHANIKELGVVEPDDASDELFDLMVAMGYYTEGGEIVAYVPEEVKGGDKEPEDSEDEPAEAKLPDELPKCWGLADPEYDPACKACECSAACWEERMRRRRNRACFGELYDPKNEDCMQCEEWRYCESAMSAG